MEKKINIAELLKDCPKGMELDCALFNNPVTLNEVSDIDKYNCPIIVNTEDGNIATFTKYGQYLNRKVAKCVIFPKGKTTWEGFQRHFKDGDIIAYGNSNKDSQIFIFKEYIKEDYAQCYIMLDNDGAIDFECGNYYVERLATEEEKQKLFDAIKDNGYKWNEETKTLEKLIKPKFKVGDKVRHKISNKDYIYEISKVYDDSYGLVDYTWMIYMKHQDYWELVPNKFDITTLKSFDKVLVRDYDGQKWVISLFSHCNGFEIYKYSCINGCGYSQCIPYEGNEHLLGATNDCDDFYKNW